ncbi:uncharacterized protein LY89DRAFT_686501 [Mollisia scopiformis]|uniref:Uncharacterized protein n=1 Tax=Mollisia scopiformis TaxID=149040 RepID=A0A194X3X8_MOLSC|nr:uncharacterized protein LY89DRAFT_686501 [Mollisia scopiformis]KUJ14890.1 hypothetical protein LY89DRAFT_686501 [Mollisia scopiformis]
MQPFDAERTVELFFKLYAVLVNLAYIPFETISFPPHELHPNDLARWGSNMDPVALDLVKKLPYLKTAPFFQAGFTIAPGTISKDFSKDLSKDLSYAQHPLDWYEGDHEYVERWSLCLTNGFDEWASGWLILDTRKGSLVM